MLTSLTSQDLKNIGKVVEKIVDERLEEKLEEKLEKKLEEKFDKKLEPVMGMLTDIFDDLQRKHEKIKDLDKRVGKLENIHPGNCHGPALL